MWFVSYLSRVKFTKRKPMEPNELRIGNWVYDSDRENPYLHQVVRIETREYTQWNSGDDFNVVVKIEGSEDGYFEMKPSGIPLTEEWLLKMGFKESHSSPGVFYIDLPKRILDNINVIGYNLKRNVTRLGSNSFLGLNIKYVHQMQNLYFALMGEELEITKP